MEAWESPRDLREALANAGFARNVGLVIRPREVTTAMKAAGERAIVRRGAGDFIGDNRVCTMSARISAKEARQGEDTGEGPSRGANERHGAHRVQ